MHVTTVLSTFIVTHLSISRESSTFALSARVLSPEVRKLEAASLFYFPLCRKHIDYLVCVKRYPIVFSSYQTV